MQTRWFKGLDKQAEADLRVGLLASINVLTRMETLLHEELEASQATQCSKDLYDSPSWAYQQADSIGQQRAFRKILRLISQETK